ncbi:MAG: AAA family ATPase [Methanobacteriaceae archaeon]|nr:AAA family ATPase [Methanobacteriaceae archaeon]
MKIGFLYVKGALPVFENFGGLPTHLVKENGMVQGKPAHQVLDGLIIPGGSIIESDSVTMDMGREIKKMALEGSFVLGMCSGFQLLAEKTDIGRRSPCPIEKEGLGLLDVTFHPMISNDRVEAVIVNESSLTGGLVGQHITGFHCHTYGEIRGEAPPLMYSWIKRTDYTDNPRKVLSGVKNDDGNVVGTMVHAALDENHALRSNILHYLDASPEDIQQITNDNQRLLRKIKGEIGIKTGLNANYLDIESPEIPPALMIASTGSDSGKTFLNTGLVGALRKRGYRVAVLKVGPDVRDLVPSLYLNKENMEPFSSIRIGGLGWKDLPQILEDLKTKNYHLVLIEGVMSIFTGLLNEKIPFSAAEIAKSADIPVVLVSGCNKGGIETAALDLAAHVMMMQKLGINTRGVILNKVYDEKIAQAASIYLDGIGLDMLRSVPKVIMELRGGTPEVEIKLEDFCSKAMETVEKYLNPEEFLELAEIPDFKGYMSYPDILSKFQKNWSDK